MQRHRPLELASASHPYEREPADRTRDNRSTTVSYMPFLHQDAIGTNTGLAGITELGHDHAFYCGIDIGIIKDDEGSIAAKFERHALDRCHAARRQRLADGSRAGEAELAYPWITCQHRADLFGVANEVER